MRFLRQSTASQVIELGPFIDDTDFKTTETGLTIANTDIKLRKEAGTTHGSKNSGGATHIANGYYYTTLDATDTNTVGLLDIHVNATGALPVWVTYWVLEEVVFDALFAASAGGYASQASVNTIDDFLDTEIAAIKAKTDNLPSDPADASDIAASFTSLAATLAVVKAVTDLLIAAQAEPTTPPAANATPLAKLAWLVLLARNKVTQTATEQKVYADDGTTLIGTATVSDDGTTFTRGEFA